MLMTEIRKDTLQTIEQLVESAASVSNPIAKLAEAAAEVLGYKTLSSIIAKSAWSPVSAEEETPLRAALRELEIEVLNTADVDCYQKERMIEQTAANFETWKKETLASDQPLRWWQNFTGAQWQIVSIDKYTQPIPEFALAKAVQIKQRVPECEIYIESLQDHPDPFLIVGMGKREYDREKPAEHYYVEVWDEPKFEGRL